MLTKQIQRKIGLAIIIIICSGVTPILCSVESGKQDTSTTKSRGNDLSSQVPNRPMIIWWARLEDSPEILRLAISSGIFSHVMLRSFHEYDRPPKAIFSHPNLKKVLKLCRERGVKVIWCRFLYPGYKFRGITTFEDICNPVYYIDRIRQLRKEAGLMGVDLVCLNAEPYGKSPLKPLKGRTEYKLTPVQYEALSNAIQTAIRIAGKADFVMPERSSYPRHLYTATCALGKLIISEGTFRDVAWKLKDKRRPADIFGAYVNVMKHDPNYIDGPGPFFLPMEILTRQELWAHKKGLFIFPGIRGKQILVARQFAQIREIYPVRDSNSIK